MEREQLEIELEELTKEDEKKELGPLGPAASHRFHVAAGWLLMGDSLERTG